MSVVSADSELDAPTDQASEEDVFLPPEPTKKATDEASKLEEGEDLKKDGARRDHGRHQQFRDHVNFAALGIFWALVACILLGLGTFTWHFLTPETCHYLSEKQLDKLQTLLSAALLSSALTQYANKRME